MRVLFVSHSGKLSGANLSFLGIINNLKEKLDITVLVNDSNTELSKTLDSMHVKYLVCKYSWWDAHKREGRIKQIYRFAVDMCKYQSGISNKKLFQLLKDREFDAVYSNTSVIDIGYRVAELLQVPHIWHVREFGEEDFGFIPLTSQRYRSVAFSKAYKIIAISEALEESLKKKYPMIDSVVISNGFDINKLKYNEQHIRNDTINILITGQVTKAKGQIQAIEAVRELNEFGKRYELFVAGDVDRDYLNECLHGQSCPEWLHVLGKISNLYDIRKEMDIELVCSKSEAFGRVTIEAMLHSVPVIGADTGATKELLSNGHGLIYKYGSIEDLKEKITILSADFDMSKHMVHRANEYASSYTVERCAESVYRVITSSNRNS